MSLTVKYVDTPVGAQETASFNSTVAQPFGNAMQLTSGATDTAWATLEPDSWTLDGSRRILSDNPTNLGWWSSERAQGRWFGSDSIPTIRIAFPAPYTATGITFTFWPALDSWCSEIYVAWYNSKNLIASTTAKPDEAVWFLNYAVEGFDEILIELRGTNYPGHFAKIQQIQIGRAVVFFQDEITKITLLNEADPSLCELTADTMTVEIFDRKNRNMIPQEKQQMQLYRNGEQIATQYITDFDREARQRYTFRCQSAIGLLEDDFLGGIYNKYPLRSVLADVFGEIPFGLDEAFESQTITGYLPVCKRREALQQIAFAIGAVVSTQGDGIIKLSEIQKNVSSVFTADRIFSGAKAGKEAQNAAVYVYAHSYKKGTEEETLLDEEAVEGNGILYVFSEPHHSYSISGGQIVGSGDNWVQITASGPVTVKGKKYIHNTFAKVRRNPFALAADKNNIVTVDEATLVHAGNVTAVVDRLFLSQQLKHTLTQDVVVSGELTGQMVTSENPWGTKTEGYIVSMDSEFSGNGQTASVTIRGVEILDESEVLD